MNVLNASAPNRQMSKDDNEFMHEHAQQRSQWPSECLGNSQPMWLSPKSYHLIIPIVLVFTEWLFETIETFLTVQSGLVSGRNHGFDILCALTMTFAKAGMIS